MRTLLSIEEEFDGEVHPQPYPGAAGPHARARARSVSASPQSPLQSDDIHIWWIDLKRSEIDAPVILSTDERARAGRFRHPPDRAGWTAARLALRQILAGYTGEHPSALRLTYGDHGKPALMGGSPLRFNLAHARERAVLAVTWEREVGIDLELFNSRLDVSPLLAVACSQTEAARITALPPDARPEAFLSCWTLKEAYLKGIGTGLFRDPRTVEIEVLPDGRATVRDSVARVPGTQWSARLLDAGPGTLAAVAILGREPSVLVRHFPASGCT
jgi:4'-phosphopantetheinyl transferase